MQHLVGHLIGRPALRQGLWLLVTGVAALFGTVLAWEVGQWVWALLGRLGSRLWAWGARLAAFLGHVLQEMFAFLHERFGPVVQTCAWAGLFVLCYLLAKDKLEHVRPLARVIDWVVEMTWEFSLPFPLPAMPGWWHAWVNTTTAVTSEWAAPVLAWLVTWAPDWTSASAALIVYVPWNWTLA